MRVFVNGVWLFFDVEGAGLVPDGHIMRERPTLILRHGGPGLDHSIDRPLLSELADVAQVVFLDHRGNGRSDSSWRDHWNLAQWGDDVRGFCDAVGITRPIVYGASFGGGEVGQLARRRFLESHVDVAALDDWIHLALPLYTRAPLDPNIVRRAIRRPEVTHWFTRPGGEGNTFNFLADLEQIPVNSDHILHGRRS